MSSEITLRCRCGTVRGAVRDLSPASCNRIVCYCEDCRAFLRVLDRPDLLDAHGGSEIVQMSPSQVRLDEGADQLRCMRLSEKGMIRFYAACCRTPLGNTISAGLPFVGVTRHTLEEGITASGRSSDEVLGASVGVNARSARGGTPPGAHPSAPLRMIARVVRLLAGGVIGRKQQPSPFFDPKTKQPRAPLEVLSVEERERLRALEQSATR